MLSLLLHSSTLNSVESNNSTSSPVTCNLASYPVTVDGKWTNTGEWSDASQIKMFCYIGAESSFSWIGNGTAYFRAKHDENYLYILVDFVSADSKVYDEATGLGDMAWAIFDADHNDGSILQNGDLLFRIKWTSPESFVSDTMGASLQTTVMGVSANEWVIVESPEGVDMAASTDAKNDPYSTSPHPIYEFKIPKNIFGGQGSVSMCLTTSDPHAGVLMVWPLNRDYKNPSTWENLTLAKLYSVNIKFVGLPSAYSTRLYYAGQTERASGDGVVILKFEEGTSHEITVDQLVGGTTEGIRYYCPSYQLRVTSSGQWEFTYKKQCYLTVKSEMGYPQGEGWYDAGSKATISVSSVIPTSDWLGALGGRYVFNGWIGDLASPDAVSTVTMDKPKTATANWRADYTMPTTILGLVIVILIVGVSLSILMRKKN